MNATLAPLRPGVPATLLILNYNTAALTLACIDQALPLLDRGWQILVVDNGSTDDSVGAIASRYPQVEMIETGRNLGFAGGNNAGLARARGGVIVLMNSDVIAAPETLRELESAIMAEEWLGALSPRLVTRDGTPQAFAFGDAPSLPYLLRRGVGRLLGLRPLHDWAVSIPIEPEWISAACLAVRHEIIEQIGGLDERFFLYFEDTDWCLRMRKAGWRVRYDPRWSVVHLGGASEPGRITANQLYRESLLAFYRKHYAPVTVACLATALHLYQWLFRLRERVSGLFRNQSDVR